MAKASIFDELLVHCAPAFNQPSFENFVVMVIGWTLAGMRAMTSGALRALGGGPTSTSPRTTASSAVRYGSLISSDFLIRLEVGVALLGLVYVRV
jgi:hypothetical protein